MTSGKVSAQLRPMITIHLEVSGCDPLSMEATLDTGYNGELLLPPDVIRSLGLSQAGSSPAVLADGTIVQLPMYAGHVRWAGGSRRITVDEADSDPLVGIAILKNHRIMIDCIPDGQVIVTPIS